MNIRQTITRQSNANFFNAKVGDTVSLALEDYISGVVASEIGNDHLEACKAQAIAARTFAWSYIEKDKPISDSSSTAQAFRTERMNSPQYPNAVKAASETKGMILTYGGKVCSPCSYSSSNGGRTTSSEERWGGVRAWLIEQNDPWDLAATGGKKSGHGVGMSQKGASYAAGIGKSYRDILNFYYPGTVIAIMEGDDTMANVKASFLITGFKQMLTEKWKYVANAAKQGAVDCSGAFTYWYKQGGSTMYHGSNTMWRSYTTQRGKLGSIDLVPGMAVFKHRNDGKEPERYRNDGLGNYYHVGQYVGNDQVIEAKGTNYGVVSSPIDEWGYAARQTNTTYDVGEVAESGSESVSMTGVVVTQSGSLNLRSGPAKTYSRIAYIPKGATITILVENVDNTGWHKVTYGGKTGYVDGSFVTINKSAPNGTMTHYALKLHMCDKAQAEEFQKVLKEIGLNVEVIPDASEEGV